MLEEQTGTLLHRALRQGLHENRDPTKAPGMQRYMKSEMPYLGIQAPILKKLNRELFKAYPLGTQEDWLNTILSIWRDADFREERYSAISLAGLKTYVEFLDLKALPCLEEMIVTGAWWDYVDAIASRTISIMLSRHPEQMRSQMLDWATSSDIWKRRTSIICQLRFKSATDVPLLLACIEPSVEQDEFFLRKAIGWALREYAKTDPAAVIAYVKENAHRLSQLSKREALRNLVKQGLIEAIP